MARIRLATLDDLQVPGATAIDAATGDPLPVATQSDLSALSGQVASANQMAQADAAIGHRLLYLLEEDLADCALATVTDSVGAEDTSVPDPHEWVWKLGQRLGAAYPAFTVLFYSWESSGNTGYRAPVTIQTGTGIHTLRAFAGGLPGRYTQQAQKYLDTMIAAPLLSDGTRADAPELIFLATGHNFSQGSVEAKRWTLTTLCQDLLLVSPRSELVLVAQNPEINDAPTITVTATGGTFPVGVNGESTAQLPFNVTAAAMQTAVEALSTVGAGNVRVSIGTTDDHPYVLVFSGRAKFPTLTTDSALLTGGTATPSVFVNGMFDFPRVLRQIAQACGYGFVNVYEAFQAVEDFPGQMTLSPQGTGFPDGTHPNDAGYELWADTVFAQMTYQKLSAPRPQQPSSLLSMVDNLLASGDFPTFSPPNAPDDWAAVNATLSKDLVNFEGARGYAVRGISATAAKSYLTQTLTGSRLRPLLGRWLTVAGRMRVNNTDTQAGILSVLVTTPAGTVPYTTGTTDEGQGAFRWTMAQGRVPSDATSVEVRLHFDFGADGLADATWDRAVATIGQLPRDMRPSAVDPFGLAMARWQADAITGLADAAAVASWADSSGQGHLLAQATPTKQPTYRVGALNGLPVVRFDGVDDFLTSTFDLPRPYTLFVVAKFNSAYSSQAVLISGNGNLGGELSRMSSTTMQASSTSPGPVVTTTPESPHLYTMEALSPGGTLAVDGSPLVSVVNMGGLSPLGITLGANGNNLGGQPASVDVAELIVFNGTLTAATKAAIRKTLRDKWGLPS